LDVGAGRDFAAGLEKVVGGSDDVEDSGVCDGEGDGRARSVVLMVAIMIWVQTWQKVRKERRKKEGL